MFDFAAEKPAPVLQSVAPALQQSAEFAGALRHVGREPLILKQLDRTLVLRRKVWPGLNVAMVSRARFRKPQRLLEMLQEQGLRKSLILLSPDHPVPELAQLGAVPIVSPAQVAMLDLGVSTETLRAGLHQKWRNRLGHGESQVLNLTCEHLPQDPDHWLLQKDRVQQSQRGYKSWPAELVLAYARENPGQARVFSAFEGADRVAAILVFLHGKAATYHIGVTTDRGRQVSAHNLLLWNAITWLRENGIRQFDLGTFNTEDAPGLARFKLGTGAHTHVLGGTWAWWPPMGRMLSPFGRLDRRLMTPRNAGQVGTKQFI